MQLELDETEVPAHLREYFEPVPGLKPKDACGIPWMAAFALRADGWWLRSDIIWCLSGGTWVYAKTQKGEMPMMIRDLARLNPATVKLWNGEKWTQLLGVSKSARQGDELELVLRSGERISCTPTHKFPTSRGLLQASDIAVGDVIEHCRLPEPEMPLSPEHITEEAAWFAGLYIAEGNRDEKTIQIAGHVREVERLERVQRIAAAYGGSANATIDGNKMTIRVYGRMLHAILDCLVSGEGAKKKGFHPTVWRYSNSFLASMLDGYLSGDGHWDAANNRWRLSFTRNYNLERDLRTVCARLGLHLTLKMAHTPYNGGLVPTFRGEIRMERSGHHNERDMGEIVEIRKARCREVYDLGVADAPHVFALASGILTHNSKPSPMPESVTDRPTKAHEYIFLLSKSERYYFDADAIKEPSDSFKPAYAGRAKTGNNIAGNMSERGVTRTTEGLNAKPSWEKTKEFRNKRSVWTIATEPFPEAHYATFPTELAKLCILAGTSERGACVECGAPWKRVVIRERLRDGEPLTGTGWRPTCEHTDAATRPCVVLDPFGGAGTTGLVADRLHRDAILIELNPEYAAMARRRIERDAGMFAEVALA